MLLGSVGNGVLLLSNYNKLQISWLVFLVKLTEADVVGILSADSL